MRGRVGRVERIIFSIFSISHASISFKSTNPRTSHCLPAISLKPTNKSLPLQTQTKPNPSLTSPSPSNPQTATNPNPLEKKRERKRESERERKKKKKKPFKPFLLSIISSNQIVEGQWLYFWVLACVGANSWRRAKRERRLKN